MKHLTQRVAWHGGGWNGNVCENPTEISFCLALDRIRVERDDEYQEQLAETPFPGWILRICLRARRRRGRS